MPLFLFLESRDAVFGIPLYKVKYSVLYFTLKTAQFGGGDEDEFCHL